MNYNTERGTGGNSQHYVSPQEFQRRERVEVGKLCRCGGCYCCEELKRDREQKKGAA